jgi:hypothetical protein
VFSPRPQAVLTLVLALLVSCGNPPAPPAVSATGSMRVAVHGLGAAPADVARVNLTVSGADMTSRSVNLMATDGVWGGVLGEIPAGTQRTFLAQAYTSADVLRYSGRAENVTVTAGTTGLVSLTLQDVSAPPPFSNEAPVLDSLVANTTSVAPGGTLSLTATAHDPNSGDTLSFAWSAPSGSFSTSTQASTQWTAPTTQGSVTLTLKVSDSRGAALSATVTVTVTSTSSTGADEVKVDFNTAPRLTGLTSSQSLLDVGQQTALAVTASDVDGDSLSYQWTATCAGSFTGATSTSATFTPSALPSAACNNCQVSVVVKDGRGGQNTGTLALCVAKSPQQAPPSFVRSYQSSATAKAGQQLTFEVEASDPANSALGFAWTASVGTLGTASTSATVSRTTWTAPACLTSGSSASLTATVTNALGAKAARSFTVTDLPACSSGTPAGWSTTGSMGTPRRYHTATLLPNGKVLVAGGARDGSTNLATAELYDPATGTWRATGSMSIVRARHAATLLPNGKVLVSGGTTGGEVQATAELYDPATGTWSFTGAMSTWHEDHETVLLANGKVLLTPGECYPYRVAEQYNPATGTWSSAGTTSVDRSQFMLAVLPGGKALLAGGYNSEFWSSAEVYNPATNSWSNTGSMATPRVGGAAASLASGAVLVTGGLSTSYPGTYLQTAELYDPTAGTWSAAAAMSTVRYLHTATRLNNGKVLVVGGTSSGSNNLNTSELYDPTTNTWSAPGTLRAGRFVHTATLLANGKVLIVGGVNGANHLSTAEVYDPGSP